MKKIRNWVVSLLSDANGMPCTRLHLAWILTGLLGYYIVIKSYRNLELQVEVLWSLITGIATMSGISIFDKRNILNGLEETQDELKK